jgi:hypothetical protein
MVFLLLENGQCPSFGHQTGVRTLLPTAGQHNLPGKGCLAKDDGAIAESENTMFHMGTHGASKHNCLQVSTLAGEVGHIVSVRNR